MRGKTFFTRNRISSSARQSSDWRELSFSLKEEYERLQQENRQRHMEVRHFESMSVSEKLHTYPSPPTQQRQKNNKLGLMLGQGRGRCAVDQILILIRHFHNHYRIHSTLQKSSNLSFDDFHLCRSQKENKGTKRTIDCFLWVLPSQTEALNMHIFDSRKHRRTNFMAIKYSEIQLKTYKSKPF